MRFDPTRKGKLVAHRNKFRRVPTESLRQEVRLQIGAYVASDVMKRPKDCENVVMPLRWDLAGPRDSYRHYQRWGGK
jgi:hypothetical protein